MRSLPTFFRSTFWLSAVVALSISAVPVLAQSREQQQTLAELRILQEQTQKLQQSVNSLADQVKELRDNLKAVNTRIDAQSDQSLKNTADIRDVLTALSHSVQTLEQRVGENTIRTQQIEQEIAPIRQGLTKLSDALAQALQALPGGAGAAAAMGSSGSAAATNLAPPTSPNDFYNQAMNFYTIGQYDLAIKAFNDYLTQFPDSPSACKAQSQIGQSHDLQNKLTEAVADYDVVIKKYPTTDCVPEALYHQAKDYEQLKQTSKAVANYQAMIKGARDKPSEAWQNADALAKQALARLGIKG